MNNQELLRIKGNILRDCESLVSQVDQLLKATGPEQKVPTTAVQPSPRMPVSKQLEKIIAAYQGDFGLWDIVQKWRQETGRSGSSNVRLSASQAINRLKQRRPSEIEVVEPGRGCRGGLYKYIGKR